MLRNRSFRSVWLAGLISDTGDWLLLVSLPIVVYEYTGSTLGMALAFLVELAPPVLFAPVAAKLADHFDRRRTMILVSMAQAAALAPLLLVDGRSGLPLVYVVIAVESALAGLFDPAKNALLPTLVEPGELVRANSLIGLGQNVGRLLGGSCGGLLLALGGGLKAIAVADAVSFLIAVAPIARVSAANAPAATDPPRRSAKEAALATTPVRAALAVALIANAAQGLFVVLFVAFVARSLHGGASEIGLLRAVQAIGAIGAGLLFARNGRITARVLTAAGAVAFGLLDLAIWNAPAITVAEPIYVLLFVAVGAPGIGLVSGLTSALQQATHERDRGAGFAAMGAFGSIGQAIGLLAGGLLGDRIGVVPMLDLQGILYLAAGACAALWLRPDGFTRSEHQLRKPVYGASVIEPDRQ